MRRFATWITGSAFALLVLLALGVAAAGSASTESTVVMKKRYTLTVEYTAFTTEESYLGEQKTGSIERTTSWTAKSVRPFLIERRGTRAKPAYRFFARVAGPLEHRGAGRVAIAATQMPRCWLPGADSRPDRIVVRAVIKSLSSVPGGAVKLYAKPTQPRPKVVWTTEETTCKLTQAPWQVTIPPQSIPCSPRCVKTPPVWSDHVHKNPGTPQKDIKFRRAFRLERTADSVSDPSLHHETVLPGGARSIVDTTLVWKLTFRPARGG